jgi:hypothetical protein
VGPRSGLDAVIIVRFETNIVTTANVAIQPIELMVEFTAIL